LTSCTTRQMMDAIIGQSVLRELRICTCDAGWHDQDACSGMHVCYRMSVSCSSTNAPERTHRHREGPPHLILGALKTAPIELTLRGLALKGHGIYPMKHSETTAPYSQAVAQHNLILFCASRHMPCVHLSPRARAADFKHHVARRTPCRVTACCQSARSVMASTLSHELCQRALKSLASVLRAC
jgi:hypothetical protein